MLLNTLVRPALCLAAILCQCLLVIAQVSTVEISIKDIPPLEVREGNEGERIVEINPQLQNIFPFPIQLDISTQPQTATSTEDFAPISKTIRFPAGRSLHGLPHPESSQDPITQSVSIERGYGIEMLADITRPTSLTLARNRPQFTDGIYVSQTVPNNATTPDRIYHVTFDGTSVEPFVSLLPEA